MYTFAFAFFPFVAVALAETSQPLLPRVDHSTGNSTIQFPTATQAPDFPQPTANAPASEVFTTGSQIIIEDAVNLGWWGPKVPVDWTFATNTSGIFFGEPDWVQIGTHLALNPKTRTRGNSFTLTMNETDEHNFLTWLIFQTNRSDIPSTPISEEISYQLSISGKFPCAHPVGNNTCASNKIDLTPDAWNTYGVDKFFEDWYNNRASTFADHGGMMQVFGRDFKIGSGHTCTIDNACNLVSSCSDLPNHGKDKNSPQVYLVWQALQNISDMLNRMYNNLNIAQGDTMTKIAQIALQFYEPVEAARPPPNPLAMSSGILGMLSAFGGLVPDGGPALGAAFGAASGLAGTLTSQKTSVPAPPDPQFARSDAELGVVFGKYTNLIRSQLEDGHTAIFSQGTDIINLLRNGTYVDRTVLNVDCDDCVPKAQAWLEQFLTLKMINYMWIKQNVFVTYMPYGKIIQLDTLKQTNFDIDACYSHFKSRHDEKNLVACMPAGMARLTYYNPANASTTHPDPDGSVNLNGMPPGSDKDSSYNSTEAVSVDFDSSWAAFSSVSGYLEHGLGYDAMFQLSGNILLYGHFNSTSRAQSLQNLWALNATSAGMFTLPVCQIRDLNYWPTFYGQGKNRRAYNDYCICWNDLNDDPIKGTFKDHVNQGNFSTFVTSYSGIECGKGRGTEPAVGGSPIGLPPRARRNRDHYVPLPWP